MEVIRDNVCLQSRSGGGKDKSRASRFGERSKEISAHTSDITNIITNVVGNASRISVVILLESDIILTAKIGTNIRCLGVNATTNTTKSSN
jgi:hypothetical protein